MLKPIHCVFIFFSLALARLDLTPVGDSYSYHFCIGEGCRSSVNVERAAPCPNSSVISFVADPTNCRSYYICNNGTATNQTCPQGFGFSPDFNFCIIDTYVRACNTINCTSDGVKPDPVDCTKFYYCFWSYPYHYTCPQGTAFDPNSQRCATVSGGGCVAPPTTTTAATTTTTTAATTTTAPTTTTAATTTTTTTAPTTTAATTAPTTTTTIAGSYRFGQGDFEYWG